MSTDAPLRFGRFVLLELLGRGGMAEVWKARLDGPGDFSRTVVVKRVLPHLAVDPLFTKMFQREARISALLNHANIVHVFELGETAGEQYLAMEYVKGLDLTQVLAALGRRKQLPPPGLGPYVALEVARALAYAHSLKGEDGQPLHLVHRDISPSNVLLSSDGSVKLLDFGIAKAFAETEGRTQTGAFKGKVGYSSPEAADGKPIDARADLFALGVVLHESLTGVRLFLGESDIQTLGLVRQALVDPPSQRRAGVPVELDRVCQKALARDPDARHATAAALIADLEPLVRTLGFGASQAAALVAELEPAARALPPATATLSERRPASPGPRRRVLPTAVLGVTAALGLVAAVATGLREPPASAPNAAAQPPPTSAPAPPLPPPPVLDEKVMVRVRSTPAGATVTANGQSVGHTPLEQEWPKAECPRRLVVTRPGYAPVTLELGELPAQQFDVQLAAQRSAPAPQKRRVANVKGGEVVDPFRP